MVIASNAASGLCLFAWLGRRANAFRARHQSYQYRLAWPMLAYNALFSVMLSVAAASLLKHHGGAGGSMCERLALAARYGPGNCRREVRWGGASALAAKVARPAHARLAPALACI